MSANGHNPRAFNAGLLLTACILSAVLWHGMAPALDRKKAITQYSHNVWQTENGLPQNSVQAIIQTHDGYLWLGTEEGVVRFDGIHFTVFDRKNTHEIKNNNIQALFEALDGSLWIATLGGGLSRLKDGSFVPYTTSDGLPSNVVRSIFEDQSGNLWIGTTGGLSRMRDGKFTSYTTKHGLAGNIVWTIYQDRKGVLWIGTSGGLSRLKHGKITSYRVKDGLPQGVVRSLYEDRDGNLWIGTLGGLSRFTDGTFVSYTTREGLSGNEVASIFEDREGSLWIGTNGGGLDQLKDGMFTTYSTQEGLSNNLVWSITESRDGSLWIGTNGGGLNQLRGRSISTISTKQGLSNDVVRSLCEATDGSLWIGTNRGLNRLKNGRITTFTAKQGLANELVRAIHEDREGNVWVGTDGGGLCRLSRGRFTTYTTSEGLANNVVWVITGGQDGSLWIGTNGGLSRYKDRRFTSYTTRDRLSSNFVISLHESKEGALWIGTMNGLNRLYDGKFTSYTTQDGLFDDAASQILEDDKGSLWMSCNKGIYRVSKKELDDFAQGKIKSVTSFSYGKADGMKSSECNGSSQPAGWKTRDGRLWFPTIKGVVVVDPNRLEINHVPPPVVIEQVIVDGQAVHQIENNRFSQGKQRFEFHYVGLSFLAPEKVRFRYRLDGLDREWVDAGTRRVAYYTNIPPGKYTFRVVASNNDGIWNEKGASFGFYLQPYFYQTYWFYACCALAFIFAGRGLYYARVKHLKRRQKELALSVDEQTRELQKEIAERKRAEEVVRESEERLREAQALGRIGNWEFDIDNQKISWSDQVYRLYERDLALGPPTVEEEAAYYAPEQVERLHEYARRAIEEGKEFRYDLQAHLPSGTLAHFAATMRPLKDESGRVIRLFGTVQDITERKRIEERYRTIISTALDGFWLLDMQGRFLDVNDAYCNLIGYSREELLTMGIPDVEAVEKPGETAARIRNIMKVGADRFETRHRCKDGRAVDIEVSVNYMRDEQRMFVFLRDITERKEADEKLRESEEEFRSLAEHSPNMIFINCKGRVIYTNKKCEEILGYKTEEFLSPTFDYFRLFDLQSYDAIKESGRRHSSGEEVPPLECSLLTRDGRKVDAIVATGLVSYGGESAIIGVVTDITERKRAEEALRHEKALMDALMDNIPDSIYFKDRQCRLVRLNRKMMQSLKLDEMSQAIGKTDVDLYGKEFGRQTLADDQRLMTSGEPIIARVESRQLGNGQINWTLTTKVPLRDDSGQIVGLVGITREINELMKAQEDRERERNLLRTLIDNLPDAVYVKDAACRKTVVNQADLRNIGCQSEVEALGKDDFELFPHDVAERFYADDQSVLQTGQPVIDREEYFFDSDGQKRWLLTTKLPLRDQKGEIIGLVGIGRDITNRIEAQEALRESQQMLRAVLDAIPARVFWKDRESRYLGCNRPFARDTGFSEPEELIGKDDSQFSWREQARLYRADDHQVMTTGVPKLNYEERQTVADGRCVWVRTSKIPLRDAKGEITGVLGTYEDITERKRAEEQIQLLAHAVESTTELISITDLEDRFTFVNKAFLDAYGYSEEEILGKHLSILRSPENPPHLGEEISINTSHGGWKGELLNRRKDGSDFPISLSTSLIRDKEGRALGLLGVARDISEHKQAEEALAKERNLLRTLIDSMPDLIYVKDTESRMIMANVAQAHQLGVTMPEEVIGKTDFDFYPQKLAAQYHADEQALIHSGAPLINKQEPTVDPAGNQKWLSTSKVLVRDTQGKIVGFVGIGRDITERKSAEDELKQSRAWFAALFDASRDGIVVERDEKIVFANKAFSELHGYKQPEELVGKPMAVVLVLEEVERLSEYGRRRVRGEPAPSLYEYRARRKDGSTTELETSVSVAEIAGNKYVISVVRDIRERKRIEEAVIKLSSAVEQGVDGVVITTKEGIIEYVNPAWERMTGYTKEEAIGNTPRILKSGKEKDEFYQTLWKTISGGEGWRGSLINKKKSGELFDAEVSIAPIFSNEHRSITHFVGIERDVTDYKRLEQQLIQALKMEGLGTLAGGVAHDFNNILGIILGHASLLEGRKGDPPKFSRSLAAISTAAERGASLVRQLLTVARKTDSLLETVNVNETIEELVRMLKETFPRTIEFSLQLGKDVPTIAADRNQLYQALLNLCVNSRDAMPNGGTLTISTELIVGTKLQSKHADAHGEKYVCIAVIDNGIGMDQKTRSRIFEPFFTTKERGRGTGLGLSVVYGVINGHNGFIDVESDPGHGATFRLYLPVVPPEIRPSVREPKEQGEIPGGTETILIVEDEEALLDPVRQALEGKGYHILAAKDGTEAFEVYRRHRHKVAAVVMDMGLPKVGGWEVFKKLRSMNPAVKVILASGYLDPQTKSEILKAGAKDFIQKPYVPEQILRRIRRVIDAK